MHQIGLENSFASQNCDRPVGICATVQHLTEEQFCLAKLKSVAQPCAKFHNRWPFATRIGNFYHLHNKGH
ncbi:MAG: hypothetical protein GY821_02885 [Gammaproteobacteria bacterium]|nr:hypothetical protein [Gammaproteobacteria bacterium]